MWDLSGPGIEPVSSALADGFFTTEPPGMPQIFFFFFLKKTPSWKIPGGTVVRTQSFYCHGLGSIPGQGTKIPQAAWHS